MAEFDSARLRMVHAGNAARSGWNFDNPADVIEFKNMVMDFMLVVKSNEAFFLNKISVLSDFNGLLLDEKAFRIAQANVEEFRYSRDYDTSGPGLLNVVLRALEVNLRPVPINDPKNTLEKEMIKRRANTTHAYLQTLARGMKQATAVERGEIATQTAEFTAIIEEARQILDN